MQHSNISFLIIFNISLFFIIYFSFHKISKFLNIYDIPSKRKIHKSKTPLIGGLVIIIFFSFNLLVLTYLDNKDFFNFLSIENYKFYYFILFLFLVIFLIGLYDDRYDLNNANKLIWISVISSVIIYSNYNFEVLNLNLSNGFKFSVDKFSFIFSSICLISLIIIMNLYDGTNLQSGLFYLFNYLLIFAITKSSFILFLFIIPIIFFLILNFSGKCFIGDSGSNFMSCLFGIMLIRFYYNHDEIFADHIFLMVFIPSVDAARLFIKRIFKNGLPFKADTNHIHHLVLSKYTYKKTIFLLSMFPLITSITILFKIETTLIFLGLLIYYMFLIKKN
tara:strand:+ start:4169 stop:5170 length:1002 start_codon:yes stop_codon:yes gene_type:complete